MSFWTNTLAAGMEAVGINPQEFGVVASQHQRPPSQQQVQQAQPWRPPVPNDSQYISPAQQMHAQAQHQQQRHGQPPPQHPQFAPNDEKGREIERLRKELRKVEEKTHLYKSQVTTLQQQVNTMDPRHANVPPVMPTPADPMEIQRLRHDLQQEQARTQQLRQEWAAAPGSYGASVSSSSGQTSDKQRLDARVVELEQELAALRAGRGTAGITTVATPTRSSVVPAGRSMSSFEAMSSMMGAPTSGLSHGSDLFDPATRPGGAKRVVIVGCNYAGQSGTLRAGVSDAQHWARFFTKKCGVVETDIRLLTDSSEVFMKSERECAVATRDNIMRALQWLTTRSASGDQIFFVFCGHGVQVVVEEFAGQRLCENSLAPTDVMADGGAQPRVISDSDVHKALLNVPSGAQATLIYDGCHAGSPLDRQGLNYLTEHVKRGNVDYEKLKAHPVLPRFFELNHWKVRPTPPEAVRESSLRCHAVQWAACANDQFCVELPIEDKARGVFTYIFICALLKEGVGASSDSLLQEMRALTSSLKGRWRLQQDVRMVFGSATSGLQKFLR